MPTSSPIPPLPEPPPQVDLLKVAQLPARVRAAVIAAADAERAYIAAGPVPFATPDLRAHNKALAAHHPSLIVRCGGAR